MNQANVKNLVSKLNFKVAPKARTLRNSDGPIGRVLKIQKTLTALIKFERIEVLHDRGDEVRGYAERLISEAIRHGANHQFTMELADYWILEKQLVHKLFKVLVPRYQDYTTSYTKLHKAPTMFPAIWNKRAILELRGNIYPSVEQSNPHEPMLLHNVLLSEARKEFRLEKYQGLADGLKIGSVHEGE